MWVFGDEFLTKAHRHVRNTEMMRKSFTPSKYEVKYFTTNKLDLNPSVIGRMRNRLAKAMMDEILLPKLIVFIIDDDWITDVEFKGFGVSEIYGKMIHWLVTESNKLVEIHKENLPEKAIRETFPSFLWMAPPQNARFTNNALRGKFTKSLKTLLDLQERHMMLKLKKVW